jgi:hypothetical protein
VLLRQHCADKPITGLLWLTKVAVATFVKQGVVMLDAFLEQKSKQLVFYLARYLRGQLPHQEMHLFIWDTLEEWAQLKISNKTPQSFREMVFWHLVYQLELCSESDLKTDRRLRRELHQCMGYLLGKTQVHADFVGIRP